MFAIHTLATSHALQGSRSLILCLVRPMRLSTRATVSGICFGLVVGALVAILPLPINLIMAVVVLVVWTVVRICRRAQFTTRAIGVAAGVATITVLAAIVAPLKQLDGVVPPLHYGHMSLDQVCDSLARDHRVFVSPDESARAQVVAAFTTDRPMTRREVLQKLARDTGTRLDIGYCGFGATLLFGAHPSFTRLRSVERPPKA